LMPAPNSRHTGGVHMLWVDGRVTFVSENVNQEVYAMSLTWNGGNQNGGSSQEY
jgi:prepilin-type processing-associated H-X9-DG protein